MLPSNMRDGTTAVASFNLELQAPQLRPEAFPWGSANNVEIHAVITSQAGRRVISLPGVMDFSALLFSGEKKNGHSEAADSLDVEIMGYDNGVTFALGNALIPRPPSTLQPTSVPKSQFRVCLMGEEGVRNGTLVGNFQACSPASDDPEAGEAVGTRASKSHPGSATGEAREENAGEADDVRQAHDGVAAAEQVSKDGHERLENEAIELLEAATKILASPRSCVGRPARPSDGPAARIPTRESTNEPDCRDVLRERQALEVPPTDVSGDFNVGDAGFTLNSAPPSKEEDEMPLPPRFPTAGFKFEPTTGNVEWQRIASVNVSKVEREGDLQTLRQFLPEIAVGVVDEDDLDANPGLVNAFRLAQLQTQYVLHCSQVLQRQCDGLETAVASMELEIKGNLQGSTALKSRARLLRKESRKQAKIIIGYAAMLRTHNPVLSSKVFLDEKGRLKVHKEATRHREREKRRTKKRRNRGCRDHKRETLEDGTCNNNHFGSRSRTGTEGSSFRSPGDSNGQWPEAGGPPREFGTPRSRSRSRSLSNAKTTATPVAEDQGSAFHLDTGEENTASSPIEQRGAIFMEQDQTISARRSDGETMTPRGRRGTSDTADRGHTRMSDHDVVQVLSRGGARKSPAGTIEPHGSENGAQVVVTGPSVGTFASDSDGWAGAGPDDDGEMSGKLEARSVSQAAQGTGNSDEGAPFTGQRKSLHRTPRVVTTVSVKPRRDQRPAYSASSQEDNTPASSPQRQGFRAETTNKPTSDTQISRRSHGIDGNKASPTTPGFAAARGGVSLTEITATENGQLSSGGDGANSEGISLERRLASGGARGRGTKMSAPRPSAPPVAAASQLGLEGEGFPDVVSEFDLDDISEIDAGGEWEGSNGGGGSLSS